MNEFIKKNINIIICIFILIQPVIDLLTGLCLHVLNINFTAGIIIKVLFAFFMAYISLFTYHKKKLIVPYLLLLGYGIFYCLGMIIYKDSSLVVEIQNLFKTFYFPVLLISIYSIKDEINISKMVLFKTLFIYLILIFIPTILGVGYKTYEITKAGTLGFFNAANEISGIVSILTPIIFIIFMYEKSAILKTILTLIYLVVILMIGTKTPLLTLFITVFLTIIYLVVNSIKKKNYKPILISFIGLVVAITALIVVIPKTNFYKNIETHLDYLELDNVFEVFQSEKLIDHFIFSQRLTFLHNKAKLYDKAPLYQKLFGIGYINNNKTTKLIEMDYFDIFYSHGIIGFILEFILIIPVIYNVLKDKQNLNYERYMLLTSFFLIIFLSLMTGHIITSPSVSLIAVILILYLAKRRKKSLLFASYSMDIGGIEKALLNLVNRIDKDKYNVTVILEKKEGIFLNEIDSRVQVKELKVNDNSNILVRKIINFTRKSIYKLFNYMTYDFSCCYATYSLSSSKIALISSKNTAFYVHNDYRTIYKDEKDFLDFFNNRNINSYRHIIFVSNENKEGFIKIYPNLTNRCHVFNNFINTKEIIDLSKEEIKVKKDPKKTILLYVGRLDDEAKKISRQLNLIKNIKDLDLWIIGSGKDSKKYESEVEKLNIQNQVTFFGKQKNPFPYMQQADYIILTSDYEGFPVTYLEAITLNKNIITTFPTSDDSIDISKYASVISKDLDKMTEEVKNIIKNKISPEKIDLEKLQQQRMRNLEEIFDEVI